MNTDKTVTQADKSNSRIDSGWAWSAHRVRMAGYVAGILGTLVLISSIFWFAIVFKNDPLPVSIANDEIDITPVATTVLPVSLERPVVTESGLVERSGVRLVQVAITGGGGLIDLRFQVVDPDKANAVHEEDNPPTIVDEATGLVVNQLLMGHNHSGPFTAGQTYYLIFENPGNIVQSGSKVSILLGDAEVDNIIIK